MSAIVEDAEIDPGRAVLLRREGAVAHVRFNRPALLNAIDPTLALQFRRACEQLAGDDSVRAVVLSGEGRAFMAGGDLGAMHADVSVVPDIIANMHAGLLRLAELSAPVIASVHGQVAGGGFGVALACDLCIAAAGTRFTMAYPLIGTNSDCGTSWGLARMLGVRRAMEVALLSEPIEASDALRLGLVNRVVPADELAAATRELAARLASGPTLAYGNLKRLLREAGGRSLAQQLDAEAEGFLRCTATADFAEGVAAFLQKRPPRFDGR